MLYLVLILGVAYAIKLTMADRQKPQRQCPCCRSTNTRPMGPTSRVLGDGGFVGSVGKSHICDSCGQMF